MMDTQTIKKQNEISFEDYLNNSSGNIINSFDNVNAGVLYLKFFKSRLNYKIDKVETKYCTIEVFDSASKYEKEIEGLKMLFYQFALNGLKIKKGLH